MDEDWRREHLKTQAHLQGIALRRKSYRAYSATWDHDPCVACWAKFAEPGSADPSARHEGYATTASYPHGEDYEWCCLDCFRLFKDEMSWVDETPDPIRH